MGISVENEDYVYRIDDLRRTGAKIKFLSVEPLLGPLLRMNLRGINWVIVGGESGPGARPLEREPALSEVEGWAVGVRDQCRRAGVPFFFKQWGGVQKKKAGRLLDGRMWDEMPREMGFAKVKKIGGVIAAFLLAGKRDTWLFSVQHILPIEEKNVASLPREFQ